MPCQRDGVLWCRVKPGGGHGVGAGLDVDEFPARELGAEFVGGDSGGGVFERYAVQHAAAEAISRKPDARQDLTATAIGDLLFGLLSPQLYLLFVRDRGWSPEDWQDWVRTTLTDQICDQVSTRKTPYSHRPNRPVSSPAQSVGG